jgi:hypothetical protein
MAPVRTVPKLLRLEGLVVGTGIGGVANFCNGEFRDDVTPVVAAIR